MYTIYVGSKPIILTTHYEEEEDSKVFLLKTVNLGKVIKLLNQTKLSKVYLLGKHQEKLLKNFLKLLPNTIAGGGKVLNERGEILFIYRNDKWDLPKGKVEAEESIEIAAIREVEEETGVSNLKIVRPLDTTYHIFKRNGKHKIKVTYWYEMKTNYTGALFPQIQEGITRVEWLDENASKEALNQSYSNIKSLIE